MLKIGDFSRLGQISVDTLRHYDTLGLLKPAVVDQSTGYRYYTFQQLGRLKRIMAFKDLGLSLEQIAPFMEAEVSTEQLKGMLKLKQMEITQRIEGEQERLTRIEARLKQIDLETHMPNYEVIIKNVRPQLVASIRRVIPPNQLVPLFEELSGYIIQQGVTQSLGITIYHDTDFRETEMDIEVTATLKAAIPENESVKVYELPAVSMASVVHNGSYNKLNLAYTALNEWVEANGYRSIGPNREMYHFLQEPITRDDESYVTEVQMPVEKIS
jgi:DNA-binding transcriptional MerR regulator